jgi:anti-anti-sigma factor
METEVDVTSEVKNNILVLYVTGRLDAVSSPQLEKKVMALIDEGDHKKVLMDFTAVDYLSSAGMRLLLTTTKKLKSVQGQFVLCSLENDVLDVIKMAGFNHILDIQDSEDDGLAKFS